MKRRWPYSTGWPKASFPIYRNRTPSSRRPCAQIVLSNMIRRWRWQATTPSPADSATNQSVDATTSWVDGGNTLTYNVYFGTDETPDETELVSENQSGTTYDPSTLDYNTTYYWRIDSVNIASDITTGTIWSFTTSDYPILKNIIK